MTEKFIVFHTVGDDETEIGRFADLESAKEFAKTYKHENGIVDICVMNGKTRKFYGIVG